MKKTISIVLIAVMLLGLLTACGGDKVADDVAVSGIEARVDEAIGNDGSLVAMDAGYIQSYMKIDVSQYADYVVKVNSKGVNIDEYGIFKGADADQTKAIEQAVTDYFALRRESWMPEYMPEEFPKLEAEHYKVMGNYVIYAILSDADAESAFDAFAACLTEG